MKTSISLPGFCAALVLTTFGAVAQLPGGRDTGMSLELTKLFGSNTAFKAKSDVRVMDKTKKETMSVSMDFSLLEGKVRTDINMAQMKSKELPEGAVDALKQAGMDQVSSIFRQDKKMIYIIYPGIQSYAAMPLSKEQDAALGKELKMEKTELGKETVEGHACVKNKIVFTDDKGEKKEALVWNATDLKDFPVRVQTQEKEDTVVMTYKQIQFVKPDAKLFEPPAGYTQYDDMQQLMLGVAQKTLGGALK
jgi:hypothetical protein